jgi:hypothetical protein
MKTAELDVVANARRAAHSRFDHYNAVMQASRHPVAPTQLTKKETGKSVPVSSKTSKK